MASVLATILSESRNLITHGISHLISMYHQTTNRQAKKLGTDLSQQNNFIKFVQEVMHSKDATLCAYHDQVRPIIMSFYTKYCCMGNTLQKKIVRNATVDQYLSEVVKFVESHTKTNQQSI